MNVKELKEKLADFPDEMRVILSIDEEGNGFHDLAVAQVTHCGVEGHEIWAVADEDVGTEYDEADLTKMLILWP